MGKLRIGTKSDIVSCLEQLISAPEDFGTDGQSHPLLADDTPIVDAVILDGAAIVNMLKPADARTFSDYASEVFLPYITSQSRE